MSYDKIESELIIFSRIDTRNVSVSYKEGVFKVGADWNVKNISAEITITKEEIVKKIMEQEIEPRDAICMLLKERVCLSSQDK